MDSNIHAQLITNTKNNTYIDIAGNKIVFGTQGDQITYNREAYVADLVINK